MEVVVTTVSYRTHKALVKLLLPTNQHPTFYTPDALPVTQPRASNHRTETLNCKTIIQKFVIIMHTEWKINMHSFLYVNWRAGFLQWLSSGFSPTKPGFERTGVQYDVCMICDMIWYVASKSIQPKNFWHVLVNVYLTVHIPTHPRHQSMECSTLKSILRDVRSSSHIVTTNKSTCNFLQAGCS